MGDVHPPLYRPDFEHDACGVAALARLDGRASHDLVAKAIAALCNLEHRGAKGAEPDTGDGAGILVQNPDTLWRREGLDLPEPGAYATGIAFSERGPEEALRAIAEGLGPELELIATRTPPRDPSVLGATARRAEPGMVQVFLASTKGLGGEALEIEVWLARRRLEHRYPWLYFPSLSVRTFVYKGMLSAPQVARYWRDLEAEEVASAICVVHSRFSTNTMPSWRLAHPFRMVAHNGEINTIRGNRNWMRARESLLADARLGKRLEEALPIVDPSESDSATFDAVFELLVRGGRSLAHAILMMIPEAWEHNPEMEPRVRDFYRFHASLMEPWDGPAAVVFTDGVQVGAVLDRNGLRPARWWRTDDGLVVLGSEAGIVAVEPSRIVAKGRLEPGRVFLVDTREGAILDDTAVKRQLAAVEPWGAWLAANLVSLEDLPPRTMLIPQHGSIVARQQLFGYTEEEVRRIIAPMAERGEEPVGSMGADTPPAVRSQAHRPLWDYFVQQFAQVTNPPLDAIREELVTSAAGTIGPEGNLLAPTPRSARQIYLPSPILDNDELAKLLYIDEDGDHADLRARAIDILYPVAEGAQGLERALERIQREAEEAIADGAAVLILSDRHASETLAPIPSLLATSAVHHHLVRRRLRTRAGLVVECGDAREVHHFAALIGFGAAAVNPYLVFDTIVDRMRAGLIVGPTPRAAMRNYVKAATKGVIKVMSKMGISTIASYTGSQVFEILGLDADVVERYFPGTPAPVGGAGLERIHDTVAHHHRRAFAVPAQVQAHRELAVGGIYQWRREGEYHLFNPETVFLLQHATREGRIEVFRRYQQLVDEGSRRMATLRGLLEVHEAAEPVPLEEVEPASSIIARFATGAMSYGSISKEAHETLAIAMNRLGARSNSGEGGEDPERAVPDPDGTDRRSRIKQVASGRFGVTSFYLVSADDLQIKIAQGAKPGEGGQLPGEKVYPWIAKTRYATPGVGLISPPPHHDIYSIEDLAQLIYDLKAANPRARVHVKLVSEVGVGTIAAGVAKAHADVILISGGDGGTGAAPLTSIQHAGSPWELGLAEAHQTLLANGLRDRVTLQVDGQLKTARDVIIAALLGAEEFGFATTALVVSGCIMMRVCHQDTCPVGIATQNPELRKRFAGRPEFVEQFFRFLAEEVRGWLARLGARSLEEIIGRADLLRVIEGEEAARLGLEQLTWTPDPWPGQERRRVRPQSDVLAGRLDEQLIEQAAPALERGEGVTLTASVRNTDRTVGTTLGSLLTQRWGEQGLPDDTIVVRLEGVAGQSLGAFLPRGITIELVGEANDYVAKGLSGGRVIVRPPADAGWAADDSIIVGNVALFGATSGECYVRGVAGERFAVRNSGALAVVEGVGDHGCEYMTGGMVVVLGRFGRNFAAGMSGGLAFLYDPDDRSLARVNQALVDVDPVPDEDAERLWMLVVRHANFTGSERARRIVADGERALERFLCIYPRDYKRVRLAAAREAQRDRTPTAS